MNEEIDIVIIGLDVPSPRVAQGIARVFGLDARAAQRFVVNLPRVVRRAASPAVAQRYADALRSIGARVECRPSLPPPFSADDEPALPAPAPAWMPDVAKTLEVERATQDAIERFRNAEGISPSMDPAMEAGAANPSIPKAPPVPHDIDRMPNAILPRWSARPLDDASPYSAAPPRAHSDADLPPAFGVRFVSGPAPVAAEEIARPPLVRPGPVGLAPAANEFQGRASPAPAPPRRASPKPATPARSSGVPARVNRAPAISARSSPLRSHAGLGLIALVALGALLWLVLR